MRQEDLKKSLDHVKPDEKAKDKNATTNTRFYITKSGGEVYEAIYF